MYERPATLPVVSPTAHNLQPFAWRGVLIKLRLTCPDKIRRKSRGCCCKSSSSSRGVLRSQETWGRCCCNHTSPPLTTLHSTRPSTPTCISAHSGKLCIERMTRMCNSVIFNDIGSCIAYLTGLRNKSEVYLEIGLSVKDYGHEAVETWLRRCVLKDRVFQKPRTVGDLKNTFQERNCCNSASHGDWNIRKHGALRQPVFPYRRKHISSPSVTQFSRPYLSRMYSRSLVFISMLLYDLWL
jgi:hypothetical protein